MGGEEGGEWECGRLMGSAGRWNKIGCELSVVWCCVEDGEVVGGSM